MQTESPFSGYVDENNQRLGGLDGLDGQWLEEFGALLEAAVERARNEQSWLAAATQSRPQSQTL